MQLHWSSGFLVVPLLLQKETDEQSDSKLNLSNYLVDEASRTYTVSCIIYKGENWPSSLKISSKRVSRNSLNGRSAFFELQNLAVNTGIQVSNSCWTSHCSNLMSLLPIPLYQCRNWRNLTPDKIKEIIIYCDKYANESILVNIIIMLSII